MSGIFGGRRPAPVIGTTAPKCPTCSKSVYHAEQIMALGKSFHKLCLKCTSCNKLLDTGSVTEHDDKPFCKPCHQKAFGTKGYGFGIGIGTLQSDYVGEDGQKSGAIKPSFNPNPERAKVVNVDNSSRCPVCNKVVYHAEEVVVLGSSWHKACLRCTSCQKLLARGDVHDHESHPYCKTCYTKKFTTKGYGYGMGSGTLQSAGASEQVTTNVDKSTYPYV